MRKSLVVLFSMMLAASPLGLFMPERAHAAVNSEVTTDTISAVIETLRKHYVFADNVPEIAAFLEQKQKDGRYKSADDKGALADLLTRDLIEITGDQHFSVQHNPDTVEELAYSIDDLAVGQRANFGFERVERLAGNIGYVRLDYFADPQVAFDKATNSMRFVENTDALIIDVRYNAGGHMHMVQLIASYLYSGDDDQLLFRYSYNREGKNFERGAWVLSGLPGKRMPDKPVYIITSSTSFSAGEWLAYSLKELGRATIIGDNTTAGAAHSVALQRANDDYVVQVPIGLTFAPVSRSDFEGKGVTPDVVVPAHSALTTAHRLALETVAKNGDGKDAEWLIPFVQASTLAPADTAEDVRDIVGKYDGHTVTMENGRLLYRWRERFSLALVPLGDGMFAAEGVKGYRFRLIRNGDRVTGLQREFRDGRSIIKARLD